MRKCTIQKKQRRLHIVTGNCPWGSLATGVNLNLIWYTWAEIYRYWNKVWVLAYKATYEQGLDSRWVKKKTTNRLDWESKVCGNSRVNSTWWRGVEAEAVSCVICQLLPYHSYSAGNQLLTWIILEAERWFGKVIGTFLQNKFLK